MTWTPAGHTETQEPQSVHKRRCTMICGLRRWLSGLEHHRQRKGQPLKKTSVRTPSPSWVLYFWILKMKAFLSSMVVLA